MERGTDPNAAWCKTKSTPEHTRWHDGKSTMSPSTSWKRAHCSGLTLLRTSPRFFLDPREKLSRPTTLCSSLSSVSSKFEPMKPAAPVTTHFLGLAFRESWIWSYADIVQVTSNTNFKLQGGSKLQNS